MMKPFKITFCGDTSLGYYYLEKSKNKYPEAYERLQNNPFSFFEGVAPLLKESSEVIINLETVLTKNPGVPIEGKEYPGFDDPDVTIEILKKLGTTAVTLANNHTMDFGEDKLVEMIDLLHANGIATIGAGRNIEEARTPYIITMPDSGQKVYILNGMRASKRYLDYGFFAEKDKAGIASTKFSAIKRQIQNIKNKEPKSKVIIVPHWQGIDYKDVDDTKKQWCQDVIDARADAVIAHGSHKKDEIEEYSEKNIYYSIGNFVFNSPGRYSAKGATPLSLTLSVEPAAMQFVVNEIITDNKSTGFRVAPVDRSLSFPCLVEQPSPTISKVLENVVEKGKYELRGREDVLFSGVDIVTNAYSENLYFVLGDDSWPKSWVRRQVKAGVDQTIKKARASGFRRFIVPYSLADSLEKYDDIESAVFVENSWLFYLRSAGFIRQLSECKVFAVTGSAGKSTTCKMLEEVMADIVKGKVFTAGGQNRNLFRNNISSLSRLMGYSSAILEVAASSAYSFNKFGFHIAPDIAIFTSIAEAHLNKDYLGTLKNVAKVKSNIFKKMKSGSYAIVNADMPYASLVCELISENSDANIITYGESEVSDVMLEGYDFNTGIAKINLLDEKVEILFSGLSYHLVLNAIAVITATKVLGYDWRFAAKKLGMFSPLEGRGAVFNSTLSGKKITVVDDSYNSNIVSLQAGLNGLGNLSPNDSGRLVAVVGDILELGLKSRDIHSELGRVIAKSTVDQVILVGEEVSEAWKEISQEKKLALLPNHRMLLAFLKQSVVDGDVIYFKASNGIGLGKVVEYLKGQSDE